MKVEVDLSDDEFKMLRQHRISNELNDSGVMCKALRVLDMMEGTPGAYEAVRKLSRMANDKKNVVKLDTETLADHKPDEILEAALGKLDEDDVAVILGYENGKLYFASSTGDLVSVNWILSRGQTRVMAMAEALDAPDKKGKQ